LFYIVHEKKSWILLQYTPKSLKDDTL